VLLAGQQPIRVDVKHRRDDHEAVGRRMIWRENKSRFRNFSKPRQMQKPRKGRRQSASSTLPKVADKEAGII
jgi:hypothetical protein